VGYEGDVGIISCLCLNAIHSNRNVLNFQLSKIREVRFDDSQSGIYFSGVADLQ